MSNSIDISGRIFHSILSGKLAAGHRLGEKPLAEVFGCSRTVVREALVELSVRGLVASSPRRGWYVAALGPAEAREAFEARRVLESAVIRNLRTVSAASVRRLREHVRRQEAALQERDSALRSFLLGDFHVCIADCLGNALISTMVRDLTARTMLVAARHQSAAEAARSHGEHALIVDALATGNFALAEKRLAAHLDTWETKLAVPEVPDDDPLDRLRQVLAPVAVDPRPISKPRAQASTLAARRPPDPKPRGRAS